MDASLPPLTRIITLVRCARRNAVLTGAGMSAESGISTFRGADDGLWQSYDPMEMATPEGFEPDRALVWVDSVKQHGRRSG